MTSNAFNLALSILFLTWITVIPSRGIMMTVDHATLVMRAEKWLKQQGCGIVFHDGFHGNTSSGELPDAIGWRHDLSILVECKTTHADFLADRRKLFRKRAELGMGDWRIYLCPPDVIHYNEVPPGWGLLYATDTQIRRIHNVPVGGLWWSGTHFKGNKHNELRMMYSALRRMVVRGHFDAVYEKLGS